MILFDGSAAAPSKELEKLSVSPSNELASTDRLIWKDPADVRRGEEVLTEEGWQQAAESARQLYREFDEPYALRVKGSGTRDVDLPRFYWPDGRPAVRVRNPLDDFYSLGAPEELYGFTTVRLEDLQPALDQLGVLTVRGDDGEWKFLHRLMAPTTRRGKLKVGRLRGVSHSAGGEEIYKFWIYDYGGNNHYAVDMRWTLFARYLDALAEKALSPREGF